MKSLVFTAESSYARFRCPHTTTSALTFLTIHPIAVKGLIGAVMGIDYKELFEFTEHMKIGIQVLNPVYKDMQSFNLIAQEHNNGAPNFQSRVEFLRDVKYRIFMLDDQKKLEEISNKLICHEYVFTPYLGASEHVAYLSFEGLVDIIEQSEECADTIIPKSHVNVGKIQNQQIYMDRIPTKNNLQREYIEYNNIAFSVSGRIPAIKNKFVKVGEYNVFYF